LHHGCFELIRLIAFARHLTHGRERAVCFFSAGLRRAFYEVHMRTFALLLLIFAACGEQECFTDPMDLVIDPKTGECIEVSNKDGCTFCGTEGGAARCVVGDVQKLDYAECRGACLAVTEEGCLATDGCHAAYADGRFVACWGTAPSGPVHTGVCIGLDAHECSRHDNCSAWFTAGPADAMAFSHCEEELQLPRDGRA
jgi:hypothetical protein